MARKGRETLKWQGITTTVLVAAVYCLSVLPYGFYRIGQTILSRDDEKNMIFITYIKIAQSIL
jgi:hypothetical protein